MGSGLTLLVAVLTMATALPGEAARRHGVTQSVVLCELRAALRFASTPSGSSRALCDRAVSWRGSVPVVVRSTVGEDRRRMVRAGLSGLPPPVV